MVSLISHGQLGLTPFGMNIRYDDIAYIDTADGSYMVLMSRETKSLYSYDISDGFADMDSVHSYSFSGYSLPPTGIVPLELDGTITFGIEGQDIKRGYVFGLNDAGRFVRNSYSGDEGLGLQMTAVTSLHTDTAGDIVVGALAGHYDVASYTVAADGAITEISSYGVGLDHITAMKTVTVGGNDFVLIGGLLTDSVTSLAVDANGTLSEAGRIYAAQGLGITTVTGIETVVINGETFVIIAAADSNSLSVLGLDSTGELSVFDHVIDSIATRIGGARIIETIDINGVQFIVVAGQEDGLSIFSLLPDGTLAHRASVEDTTGLGLATISGFQLTASGDDLVIHVTSSAETGVQSLTFSTNTDGTVAYATASQTLGTSGDDTLFGSDNGETLSAMGGNDFIFDGAGVDTISTGYGADVIVLANDGAQDTITDFNVHLDTLNLSGWTMLRNVGQLHYTVTATGGIVTYGDEILVLQSHDGMSLMWASVANSIDLDLSHYLPELGDNTITAQIIGDTLIGTRLSDVFEGSDGKDTFIGAGGLDRYDGKGGFDMVDYSTESAGVVIDMTDISANQGGARGDIFFSIEGFIATDFDDDLQGDNDANCLLGRDGNDIIKGGGGDDELGGGDGNDTLYGDEGDDLIKSGNHADYVNAGSGNDRVLGGNGNDMILGDTGHDYLDGGADDDTIYGGADNDTLLGAQGNDRLYGDEGDDTLSGGSSKDRLEGGAGDDILDGGSGRDRLYGGNGNDTLTGGTGSDYLNGYRGNDILDGGDHNDRLYGGTGDDTLYGGAGNDTLDGEDDTDTLYGGRDDDTLRGGAGNDVLSGNSGNDRLEGGPGSDTLIGGSGRDRLYGGNGDDTASGGTGSDYLNGYRGDDTMYGEDHNDRLDGGVGNDMLYGGSGDDQLRGQQGDDTLSGNAGKDRLYGGIGDDTLYGHSGSDRLYGGEGNDTLYGGEDNDILSGGTGTDTLTGGTGNDVFIFSGGTDTITDFELSGDRVALDASSLGLSGDEPVLALINSIKSWDGADFVLNFGDGDMLRFHGFDGSAYDLSSMIDLV